VHGESMDLNPCDPEIASTAIQTKLFLYF